MWPSTRQRLTILCIFDHFRRQIDVNWRQYLCYLNKYSFDSVTDCRNWYKLLWKPSKSGIVAICMTKIDDFVHFRSFSTSIWRQYVCYFNEYSSDSLTNWLNWYKPLWKPLKSGIVAIYTTKIADFAHFRSILTSSWRQLTSMTVLYQNIFIWHTFRLQILI